MVDHRDLPTDATVKSVTVKREPTGKWYAVLSVEMPDEPPEKPTNPENVVGIDVGIVKFAHDTDGTAVESLDLSHECEQLEHEQRVWRVTTATRNEPSRSRPAPQRWMIELSCPSRTVAYLYPHPARNESDGER